MRNIARICIDQGGDAEALASTLQRVGLSASLRKVMGNKLHSLRHSFVVVAAAGESVTLCSGCSAAALRYTNTPLQPVPGTFIARRHADASSAGTLGTYIVDPAFRDAFAVAHPTPRYAAIVASLPQEVVATPVSRAASCGGQGRTAAVAAACRRCCGLQ